MSTTNIQESAVNLSILDKIGEGDVRDWMIARLHLMRQGELPEAHSLAISANFATFSRERYFYFNVGVHGAGKCSSSSETIAAAVNDLRQEIQKNPAHQAAMKRVQAETLLREAEELTAVAKRLERGGS